MNTQTPWAARITRAIAGEIRQRRTARGMSAEDLAAACADLGMPISVQGAFEGTARAFHRIAAPPH